MGALVSLFSALCTLDSNVFFLFFLGYLYVVFLTLIAQSLSAQARWSKSIMTS